MNATIQTHGLRKRYGHQVALDGVSLDVGGGELFGLVGPDGAGKTTLLRILATLLLPDAGEARIGGTDVVKGYRTVRQRIGYMPGRFSLYPDLSIEENLRFFATLFGTSIRENYALVAPIYRQIEPFRHRRADKLSGGMKQKLALCCALIHRPAVLLLDEPTTGVDPVSRREFWDMLGQLRTDGLTILVSTPYMDEASRCDRIALVQSGRLLRTDTPQAVAASFGQPLWAVSTANMRRLLADLRHYGPTASAFSFGTDVHAAFRSELQADELAAYLASCGHSGISIRRIQPSVEDTFMRLLRPADPPTTQAPSAP